MCVPLAVGPGLAGLGLGGLLGKPLIKPLLAHNGLDSVNKTIYGSSGKSPAPKESPLAVTTEPPLAKPLGVKTGTGYTSEGYNGLQI